MKIIQPVETVSLYRRFRLAAWRSDSFQVSIVFLSRLPSCTQVTHDLYPLPYSISFPWILLCFPLALHFLLYFLNMILFLFSGSELSSNSPCAREIQTAVGMWWKCLFHPRKLFFTHQHESQHPYTSCISFSIPVLPVSASASLYFLYQPQHPCTSCVCLSILVLPVSASASLYSLRFLFFFLLTMLTDQKE